MIAHEDVGTLFGREKSDEFVMGLGKEPSHVMKEPVDLGTRAEKDTAQH